MFNYLTNFDTNLFDEFRRLEREVDQLLFSPPYPSSTHAATQENYPPTNIGTTDEHVDIYLFAPSLDLEKLDISIQHNVLTINGSRKHEAVPEGAKSYRKDRNSTDFKRVFSLPDDVDQEQVDASYLDGVLHITVHRKESLKPRQITVN